MPSDPTNPKRQALQVSTITTDAGFTGLHNAWNDLNRNHVSSNIFLSHEWFAASWAWRRQDSTLCLQVARRGGHTVGILPLIRERNPQERCRRLELLTVVDTQVADLIAAPADLAEITQAFAESLTMQRDWDILQLDYLLPEGAILRALVPSLARRGLRVQVRDGRGNPFVALDGTWKKYYDTRSRRLKKANNLAANRMQKAGEVRIAWLRPDSCDESQIKHAIDIVIDISRRSWKRETDYSLDQPGPQAFIRSLSQTARERGWLSIWLMYVGDQPLAMEYQLIDKGNVHALRSDFDQSYEAISPGTHLFRQLLESSFGRGLKRYYMGPGDNPYKLRWTDQSEGLRRVIVYNRTLRGRLAWLREAVAKPVFRALRDRFASPPKEVTKEGSTAATRIGDGARGVRSPQVDQHG